LLNHTSGIADFTQSRAYAAALDRNPAASWSPQKTLRYAGAPVSASGSEWHYSSTNYILLGLVIKRATGSGVARELHRRLLDRRTFPRIVLQGDERPVAPVATGHFSFDHDPDLEHTRNDPYVPSKAEATANWTAGGMMATAENLALAGDGILGGRLLSARSRREMTQFIPAEYPPAYGLGLGRDTLAGVEAWGHPGDVIGFHAELWYLPKYRATIAALGNYQTGEFLGPQRALAEVLIAEVVNELTNRHLP
jgi:D-alanyl-D-alanine carboxypeptidase